MEEDQIIHKALYTKDIQQKSKRRYDGFIIFKKKQKRLELYTDDNDKIGRLIFTDQISENEIEEGNTINTNDYLIEIYERINGNETDSNGSQDGKDSKELEEKRKDVAKPLKKKKLLSRKPTIQKPLIQQHQPLLTSKNSLHSSNSFPSLNRNKMLGNQLQQKRSVEDIIKLFEEE